MSINEQTITDFKYHFHSVRGFQAIPTQQTNGDGKRKFNYQAIKHTLKDQDWRNHFNTEVGLTPSPIFDQSQCNFGALDIDDYSVGSKKKLIQKAKILKLVPAETKSGGLHLYCFSKDDIQARNMRAYLNYCKKELKLDPKTEVFPKQNEVKENEYGNGITIPYRAYGINKEKAPKGLAIINDEVIQINPEQFIINIKNAELPQSHFSKYDTIDLKEEPEDIDEDFAEGSMQDPEMQKLSGREILQEIRTQKMTLDNDSFFDDMITLFVGKGVVAMSTDEEILQSLLNLKDEEGKALADEEYYKLKIKRTRLKFNIEDPEIARAKLLVNVIYIMSRDKFFDLSTNEEYDKSAINFKYARLFKKITPSTFIMNNARRKVVEDWIYDPKQYNAKERLVKQDEKLYLNSFLPGELVSEPGDINLWDHLLDHLFNDQTKYKDHFLDWLAYQVQNRGEKIRYACIVVSTQYQVGKGSIWRAIKLMFGSHNAKEIDVGQALDKSKGYLTNSQIVLIDEMQSAGKFEEKMALLNNLKRIITEENISSRALYIDYKIIKSCTNYLLFTNNKDALSLPPNEVRYWVYISEQARLNDTFYADYHKWLDNGGAKAILHSLQIREISKDFLPKGIAPDTPFRSLMQKGGEHPLTKVIRQHYEEMIYPFEEKQIIIGSLELYNTLKKQQILGRARINDVSNALEQIGGRCLGQCRIKIDSKVQKPTLYLIREQDKYFGRQSQELVDELYFPVIPKDTSGGHY